MNPHEGPGAKRTAFQSLPIWGPWSRARWRKGCGCRWRDDTQGHRVFHVWQMGCDVHSSVDFIAPEAQP